MENFFYLGTSWKLKILKSNFNMTADDNISKNNFFDNIK